MGSQVNLCRGGATDRAKNDVPKSKVDCVWDWKKFGRRKRFDTAAAKILKPGLAVACRGVARVWLGHRQLKRRVGTLL